MLVFYAGWWLVWICIQVYLIMGMGFPWSDALHDALITQGVVAVGGYIINTSMHSYRPSPRHFFYVLVWSVTLAFLSVSIQQWLIGYWSAGSPNYVTFIRQSTLIRGLFAWLMIIIIAILTWLWVYISDLRESDQRQEDSARLAREAELSNLRMQMQPHFLFNSLNSISALVGTQPEQARAMIHQLSDFLRGTIKREDRQLISLEEELKHLQLYLDIEKVRFGHRLKTVIQHNEKDLKMRLPSLLLQPVVENAIKFGLYDTIGEITISISVRSEKSNLLIEIKNPFDPETSQPLRGTGFGLNSIQRRLTLLYFQTDLLQTRREENIFITIISIPQPE